MFDVATRPYPPKLREIIDYNWEFPTDFPVVDNSVSPDATRTLKMVINKAITDHYFDHRINQHNVADFTRHLQSRIYNLMVQHQNWIHEYLNLIEDNQFFYNDETQSFSRSTNASNTTDSLQRENDTAQGFVTDIDNYLSGATKTNDTSTGSGTSTENNTIHKSTLGDITVQFTNFANFPNFIYKIIDAVAPCFIRTYPRDYDKDQGYMGFRFERLSNPARTHVYDVLDRLVAKFTDGASSVELKGPYERTFIETSQGVSDTFGRTIVDGWGRSEIGGRYFITESVATDFDVADGWGTMDVTTANASRRATLTATNAHKSFYGQVKIKTDKAAEGAGQDGGITFGYQDLYNHFEAVLRFSSSGAVQVGIIKKIDGDTTNIINYVQVAASRNVSDVWRLKMSWNGDTGQIKVKAWIVGDPEPGSWAAEATDTTYRVGRIGIRSICNTSTSNLPVKFSYDDFIGTGDWPENPTVIHDKWVRFLSAPFSGSMSKDTIAWLIKALKDTTPDFLAVMWDYTVMGTKNIGYGPLEADGVRNDGSDWNDTINQVGYYPDTSEGPDDPEPAQFNCADCSGAIRLVLRQFGIPLSLYVFDTIHLPRESKDMMEHGPGVIVIPHNNVQLTDFSLVQIGDMVGADADLTDLEENQLDHVLIVFGYDTKGGLRAWSSRATPNGPTIADAGGKSIINGTTNVYSVRSRSVKRI